MTYVLSLSTTSGAGHLRTHQLWIPVPRIDEPLARKIVAEVRESAESRLTISEQRIDRPEILDPRRRLVLDLRTYTAGIMQLQTGPAFPGSVFEPAIIGIRTSADVRTITPLARAA
jgi:hypothetical protein